MSEKPKTLEQAIRYFADDDVCIATVAGMRWPDAKPVCPACGHKEHYYLAKQRRWKCKECWKQFSVKVGTIFEDSAIPLNKWLVAIWLVANCKNGVSSYEIHRAIGVTQKSAWFMLHRIRLALHNDDVPTGGWGKEFEADETYVAPKPKNMHKERKLRYNRQRLETGRGSTPVIGVLDRENRQVRATVLARVERESLQNHILNSVKYGSTVYTDDSVLYDKLRLEGYVHDVVNHCEEYVRGRVHTNGIENFWSLLKRNLHGTYVAVEPFHLFRYVDEQVFRYNNRGSKDQPITDRDRFYLAVSQIANKRLTFAEVTGKVGDTTQAMVN